MILISHRGNINGRNPKRENDPKYIEKAIEKGYNVEIDIWMVDGRYMLGHDVPKYPVSQMWLVDKKEYLWLHAKNYLAFVELRGLGMNYFWHETDRYTLTSAGYIWAFPGFDTERTRTIAVSPERFDMKINKYTCAGVCSDNISKYGGGK